MPFDVSPLTLILFIISVALLIYGMHRKEDAPRRDSRNRNRYRR